MLYQYQPTKVLKITMPVISMSARWLCSGCFNPQCRPAVYWKTLDKDGAAAAAAAEHDIIISLPLMFPVRFLSLTPPEFPCPAFIRCSNSFFLKLWHHPVWAVVALLSLTSRWQLWLMESGCCWKNASPHWQDEVILLKNLVCILIHSFRSCNFLPCWGYSLFSSLVLMWSQPVVSAAINLESK